MGRRRRTPDGRVYVHPGCGGMTKVSGNDFTRLCDPFSLVRETFCCGCNGFVPVAQVHWEDTGEVIADFRRRVKWETPGVLLAWYYGLGFAAGAVLGLPLGALFDPKGFGGPGWLIGAAAGGLVVWWLGGMVLKAALGVDYRRLE